MTDSIVIFMLCFSNTHFFSLDHNS